MRKKSWDPVVEASICQPSPIDPRAGEKKLRAVVWHEHGGMEIFIYEENYPDPEFDPVMLLSQ